MRICKDHGEDVTLLEKSLELKGSALFEKKVLKDVYGPPTVKKRYPLAVDHGKRVTH